MSGFWHNYFALHGARVENETLRAEKARLEGELIKAQEQVKFAEQAGQLAKYKPVPNVQSVTGRVIARDATQWFKTVFIDCGSFSGVRKDQPVVTVEGLVGRVINVAPNAAQVLLLTDERHGAGAIVGQLVDSRLLGFVKGRGEYQCEMHVVSPESEKVPANQLVITSGLDGLYPRGLVIGRVAQETPSSEPIPVIPAAPLAKLDVVSVLLIQPDQLREEAAKLMEESQSKPAASKGK